MYFFPLAAHEVTAITNYSATCPSNTECTATTQKFDMAGFEL